MKKSMKDCPWWYSITDIVIAIIIWCIVFGFGIFGLFYLVGLVKPVGGRIIGVSDVSTRHPNGTIKVRTTRYVFEAPFVSGRIETEEFRRPDDSVYELIYDIGDTQTQCEMSFYRTVCDVDLDFSRTYFSCFPTYTCTIDPAKCTGLCSSQVIQAQPVCFFSWFNADVCAIGEMKITNCYDVWLVNPTHCKPTGTISINFVDSVAPFDDTEVFDIITGYTQSGTFGGNLDITFTIDHIDRPQPFGRELVVITPEGLTTSFDVVERSSLCVFNNDVGCKGPVYKDSGNTHVITNGFTRVSGMDITHRRQDFSTDNNRLIATALVNANSLKAYTGSFTFNTTSFILSFEQTKAGTVKFDVDITDDQQIGETIPECSVISDEISCTGDARQELMSCELKLVVAPAIGASIDLEWNGDTIPIECVSGTKTLPSIPTVEGKALGYTIYATGSAPKEGTATTTISHPSATDDQDTHNLQGFDGKKINPDKIFEEDILRNNTLFGVTIGAIVVVILLFVLGLISCIWRIIELSKQDYEDVGTELIEEESS